MKPNKRQDLAALVDELTIRRTRQSLRLFVPWAWPSLEPGTVFQANWHIALICEYLEAVTAGEVLRLVINIPPRYMKSLLVSVLWPCWEWYRQPSARYIFSSYAEPLASHHSLSRRRLIRSRPYQRFAPDVHLTKDQQEKLEFHTTKGGIMVATSTGGSITGKGGTRLIIDDPHNPTQAESDTQRQQALDFYRYTLSTRLDDPKRDAIVVVMQRLHTRDLTAVCLEQGFEHCVCRRWRHVIPPSRFRGQAGRSFEHSIRRSGPSGRVWANWSSSGTRLGVTGSPASISSLRCPARAGCSSPSGGGSGINSQRVLTISPCRGT